MKLNHNFIRLPLKFDVERLKQELSIFEKQRWMPHPNDLEGNSAMPLISKDGADNDDFHGSMKPTPHLRRCEYIQQILGSFGEVFGRSRLMRLEPGCEVSLHTDTNFHWHSHVRIHIPITTYPEVIFHCGESAVHMQAGECWIFDAWQQHRVVNDSDKTRVHLVIDTAGSSSFWKMVETAEVIDVRAGPEDQLIAYEKGKKIKILTERFNFTPVMSPGELDGLVDGLVQDFMAESSNNESDASAYAQVLFDFSKDWRSLFYLYGYEEAGNGAYVRLLDLIAARLKDLPGNVVTASNSVPVRDIIFFKIFSAATAPPAVREQFLQAGSGARIAPGRAAPVENINKPMARNQPCHCGSGKKYKRCHGAVA